MEPTSKMASTSAVAVVAALAGVLLGSIVTSVVTDNGHPRGHRMHAGGQLMPPTPSNVRKGFHPAIAGDPETVMRTRAQAQLLVKQACTDPGSRVQYQGDTPVASAAYMVAEEYNTNLNALTHSENKGYVLSPPITLYYEDGHSSALVFRADGTPIREENEKAGTINWCRTASELK